MGAVAGLISEKAHDLDQLEPDDVGCSADAATDLYGAEPVEIDELKQLEVCGREDFRCEQLRAPRPPQVPCCFVILSVVFQKCRSIDVPFLRYRKLRRELSSVPRRHHFLVSGTDRNQLRTLALVESLRR